MFITRTKVSFGKINRISEHSFSSLVKCNRASKTILFDPSDENYYLNYRKQTVSVKIKIYNSNVDVGKNKPYQAQSETLLFVKTKHCLTDIATLP